jgi:hypothetical protein
MVEGRYLRAIRRGFKKGRRPPYREEEDVKYKLLNCKEIKKWREKWATYITNGFV